MAARLSCRSASFIRLEINSYPVPCQIRTPLIDLGGQGLIVTSTASTLLPLRMEEASKARLGRDGNTTTSKVFDAVLTPTLDQRIRFSDYDLSHLHQHAPDTSVDTLAASFGSLSISRPLNGTVAQRNATSAIPRAHTLPKTRSTGPTSLSFLSQRARLHTLGPIICPGGFLENVLIPPLAGGLITAARLGSRPERSSWRSPLGCSTKAKRGRVPHGYGSLVCSLSSCDSSRMSRSSSCSYCSRISSLPRVDPIMYSPARLPIHIRVE